MSVVPSPASPLYNGRPDIALTGALQRVSPQMQQKARASAEDFEAVFLNTMLQQAFEGVKGDGPLGNTQATGPWRSMLTDEYARSMSKAGGIGIANDVFRTLIMQQAARG